MSKHGTIRRYLLIIEKAGGQRYPSFEQLKDFLFDQGFEISGRTLQRDLEQIRNEFKIEVCFDPRRRGYFIDEENSIDIPSFIRYLEIINTGQVLAESLKDGRETLKYIHFGSSGELAGLNNLGPLLYAIRNHRIVRFFHKKFRGSDVTECVAQPYMLKEYDNRWYLVCLPGGLGEFRTYGIDRIQELTVSDTTFEFDNSLNPASLFEHTIGLTYSEHEPQEVVLSFTRLQGKYIKTLPWHASQEVLIDNEEELRVSLFITPNYEFRQRILMLGANVKVIKPRWLADEVKEALKAALGRYR